jgi:hypothetical protein
LSELFAGRALARPKRSPTVADVARFGISKQTSAEFESELTFLHGGYESKNRRFSFALRQTFCPHVYIIVSRETPDERNDGATHA